MNKQPFAMYKYVYGTIAILLGAEKQLQVRETNLLLEIKCFELFLGKKELTLNEKNINSATLVILH